MDSWNGEASLDFLLAIFFPFFFFLVTLTAIFHNITIIIFERFKKKVFLHK